MVKFLFQYSAKNVETTSTFSSYLCSIILRKETLLGRLLVKFGLCIDKRLFTMTQIEGGLRSLIAE